jgi:outer membrane protein OmpU
MKNILLTSTALVAFAGAAAADVAITGYAEMGIFGGSAIETQFFTDIDVTFSMSGETDNGLTFGAAIDIDEAAGTATTNNADDGGVAMFISGNFGTLTLGDTDGALDWAITDIGNMGNPGSLADDETAHAAYIGNGIDGRYDGQILRYNYSFGDFGVAVSVEQDDTGTVDDGFAIGFKYSMDMGGVGIDFGLGYQEATILGSPSGIFSGLTTGDDLTVIGMSVVGNFGDFQAGLNYAEIRSDLQPLADGDYIGFGVGYSANGLTVHANYAELDVLYAPTDREGYGLSVAYDLGGGAVVHGGYGSASVGSAADVASWSLGLGLSF